MVQIRTERPTSDRLRVVDPPSPPRVPFMRRCGRSLTRFLPFTVWCAALVATIYLYTGESQRGDALAYEDILELRVAPAVSGRLSTVVVEPGQEVLEGDLIATLDGSDLEVRLRFARAQLERTRTRIDAVRGELQIEFQDRVAQAAARRAAYETEGRRLRDEILRLEAADASDRSEIASLAPQIDRLTPLLERGLVTADRLEGLVQQRTVLERRLAAQAARGVAARAELEAWKARAPDFPAEPDFPSRLLPFELEIEAQAARVAELELERGNFRVHAPATGRINRISLRPGEWCEAGAEIAEIVVPRPNRVTAYLVDRQIGDVEPGTRATLRPRERRGPALEGRVVRIGPRIEQVPRRLRAVPSLPAWGRLVAIEVEGAGEPLPGEIYAVRFER